MTAPDETARYPVAGLFRRLMAMFYDSLLLMSCLLVATALVMLATRGTLTYHNPYYKTLLFLICFSFHTGFWMHGGQTLGMRAWRLRVQNRTGGPVTIRQATLRFMLAIPSLAVCGLGFLWMLVDRRHLTVYDRLSESEVVLLPKPGRWVRRATDAA